MATLGDAVALTLRIDALTDELHREARREGADLPTLVELADEIAEYADMTATAFSRINDALEASFTQSARAAPAQQQQQQQQQPAVLTRKGDAGGSTECGRLRRLAAWATNVYRALAGRLRRRRPEGQGRRLWSRRPFRRAPQGSA